jgi:rhodanese-related sulfurtransferase
MSPLRESPVMLSRITRQDLKRRMDAREPIAILDTRSEDAWNTSDAQIPGAVRMPPDDVAQHLSEIPRDRLVVTYCT